MSACNYQAVILINADLDEQGVSDQLSKVKAVAESHGGDIIKTENWGRRQLAYKINKKDYGIYLILEISGDNALVSDLDRQLKINDQVMRHLVVKKDKHAPDGAAHLKDGQNAPTFSAVGEDFFEDEEGIGASV